MQKTISTLIAAAAALCAACVFVAGPGTRLGFWDYSFGLQLIREVAAPKALLGGVSLSPLFSAAGLSLLAALAGAFTIRGRTTIFAAVAGIAAIAAAVVPLGMRAAFEANPFIHDITTDFENPPAIVAAAGMTRKNPPEYRGDDAVPQGKGGATVAEAQRTAFPDIKPIMVDANLEDAAKAATSVVLAMGMEILAEGPADGESGGGRRIEAVATSFWFGFKDDFIVRLTPAGDGQTRVDVRSKSRVGGSDLGANAKRVREFAKRLSAAV